MERSFEHITEAVSSYGADLPDPDRLLEGREQLLKAAMKAFEARQPLFHGTKADLKRGDLIEPGYQSNFGKRKKAAFVYVNSARSFKAMKDNLERLKQLGVEAIEE